MEELKQVRRRGFTLIEILAVLAIMMLMMTIAMFGFLDFGRGARLRAGLLEFRSILAHARQDAVTYRRRTTVYYGSIPPPGAPPGTPANRGYYYVSNAVEGVVGVTNFFKEGLLLTNDVASVRIQAFQFKLDGSCELDFDRSGSMSGEWQNPNFWRDVLIYETGRGGNYLSATTRVYQLTGLVKKWPQ